MDKTTFLRLRAEQDLRCLEYLPPGSEEVLQAKWAAEAERDYAQLRISAPGEPERDATPADLQVMTTAIAEAAR